MGPAAFWKARMLIQAVMASRSAIRSSGRGPIRLTKRKASKAAMCAALDQVRNLADRECWAGPLM